MRNPFEKAKTWWVRYSDYQWRTTKDGVLYIQPAPGATFTLYNAMEVMEQLVLDALNAGRKLMGKEPKEDSKPIIMDFVRKYGLLGMMTALLQRPNSWIMKWCTCPRTDLSRKSSCTQNSSCSTSFLLKSPI